MTGAAKCCSLGIHPHTPIPERLDTQLRAKHRRAHREINAAGSRDLGTKICCDAPATKATEATLTYLELLKPVMIKLQREERSCAAIAKQFSSSSIIIAPS